MYTILNFSGHFGPKSPTPALPCGPDGGGAAGVRGAGQRPVPAGLPAGRRHPGGRGRGAECDARPTETAGGPRGGAHPGAGAGLEAEIVFFLMFGPGLVGWSPQGAPKDQRVVFFLCAGPNTF